ncbi:MAG: LysM peptidoglycan-binding domain-containing protein [Bacillaceae bacterium]|nr:LysM peptidoglycan-binding domain-containing protein [Bacillaceae bacterium]
MKNNDESNKIDQATTLRESAAREKKALPPRSKLHANKKKKTKWKIHYPMVRLIGIAFFLIPIAILAIVLNEDQNIISKILPLESSIYEPVHVIKPTPTTPPASEEEDKEEEEDKKEDKKEAIEEEEIQEEVVTEKKETQSSDTVTEEKEEKLEPVIEESVVEDEIEIIYHTVQKEETLFSISVKYYNGRHGEKIIKDFNNLITNQVNVGQTLKIPMKKE